VLRLSPRPRHPMEHRGEVLSAWFPALRSRRARIDTLNGTRTPVEWHQDWAFYPHTNDDLAAVGVMFDDMAMENGDRRLLLYQFRAADAWPILGFPAGIEAYEALMVAGQSRQPRLSPAPVRLPLPPAVLQGSLYENQKGMKTRFFDMVHHEPAPGVGTEPCYRGGGGYAKKSKGQPHASPA
jgi:hypothetical protein